MRRNQAHMRRPRSNAGEIGGYIPPREHLSNETLHVQMHPTIILGKSQKRVLADAMSGKNILITGPGGTGKSELLGRIIRDLCSSGTTVAVTASTGVAALRIGGSTIHSFLGTNICNSITELCDAYTQGNIHTSERCFMAMLQAKIIIVDEISMLSGDYLDMVDYHLRDVCSISKPFGGKQVIFCGDFLQLPPVIKDIRKVKNQFAFQSEAWKSAGVKRCVLSENFRQSDREFIGHLNSIRFGELPRRTVEFLKTCVGRELSVDEPLKLFAINRKVDTLNRSKLASIPGGERTYHARFRGDSRFYKTLEKNSPVPAHLHVKTDARVMLCRNDYEAGYRNGQRGVLLAGEEGVSTSDRALCVQMENGQGIVRVKRHRFEWKSERGAVLAEMEQYPLRLAWAVSIHKSQGMTLDNVVCDLRDCFEAGQAYVAMSRVRSAGGLSLVGVLDKKKVFAHGDCCAFYPRVKRPS